jgi:hypothetical protein
VKAHKADRDDASMMALGLYKCFYSESMTSKYILQFHPFMSYKNLRNTFIHIVIDFTVVLSYQNDPHMSNMGIQEVPPICLPSIRDCWSWKISQHHNDKQNHARYRAFSTITIG